VHFYPLFRAPFSPARLCAKNSRAPEKLILFLFEKQNAFFALISPDFVNKLFPPQGQFCSELYRDKVKRFCLLYFNTVTRFQNKL